MLEFSDKYGEEIRCQYNLGNYGTYCIKDYHRYELYETIQGHVLETTKRGNQGRSTLPEKQQNNTPYET